MRPSKRHYYLQLAEVIASRSTCLHKHYGAVIVKNDRIIATGYNGAPRGEPNCCDVGVCYRDTHVLPVDPAAAAHGGQYGTCVAVHAEQNAMLSASQEALAGATLYLVGIDPKTGKRIDATPCNICSRMIRNSGLEKVILGRAEDDKSSI